MLKAVNLKNMPNKRKLSQGGEQRVFCSLPAAAERRSRGVNRKGVFDVFLEWLKKELIGKIKNNWEEWAGLAETEGLGEMFLSVGCGSNAKNNNQNQIIYSI